jgi:signal transduction histidine kinase
MFKLFAQLISTHLDSEERLAASEAALSDERGTAELREQFIAVLGHDLRTPLASIDGGARVLLQTPLTEKATQVVGRIQRSAARMAGLIDNVLDFARGRLGGGLSLVRVADPHLGQALEQVIAELQAAWPHRGIQWRLSLEHPVVCDRARLAQLFSNLLSNALTHGDPLGPVRVAARTDEHGFEFSVSNIGEPIPPETVDRLFQPFSRASARPGQQGLGLGLYIASEIARAHEGSLTVTSTQEETRFTFRMPVSG